jgi:hypothetical protein
VRKSTSEREGEEQNVPKEREELEAVPCVSEDGSDAR